MVATVAVVLVFQEFLAFQACSDRKVIRGVLAT
jgi:hypothetical protein